MLLGLNLSSPVIYAFAMPPYSIRAPKKNKKKRFSETILMKKAQEKGRILRANTSMSLGTFLSKENPEQCPKSNQRKLIP